MGGEIDDVDRIPELVSRAFHVAMQGRPGPVVLSVPEDVLSAVSAVGDPIVKARLDAEASRNWLQPSAEGASTPYAIDMKSQPYASHTAYALTAKNEGNPPAVVYALSDDFSPKVAERIHFVEFAGLNQ